MYIFKAEKKENQTMIIYFCESIYDDTSINSDAVNTLIVLGSRS